MQITQFKSQPRFPILAPNGSTAAPSYSFSGDTNCGFYYVGSDVVGLAANGAVGLLFGQGVLDIPYDNGLLRFGVGVDTILTREAANTLALRNSTNAQTFRVYNTYTDASNYERAVFQWSSNVLQIGTEAGGTGTGRAIRFITGGSLRWEIGITGTLFPTTSNSFDFGATTNAARNIFAAGYFTIGDGVTAPTATAGLAKLYVDTADGDLKVIFGDGTIKTIATDT